MPVDAVFALENMPHQRIAQIIGGVKFPRHLKILNRHGDGLLVAFYAESGSGLHNVPCLISN